MTDSAIVECDTCGRTGLKTRIQPTTCPHDSLDNDREGVMSVTTGPGDINTGMRNDSQ
ncbi:hypothetical protein JT689_01570 (plasmid) [Halobacterium sp. GSL-19]|uniref:hypothetical protein n=1 Tax=Halobacterium sp. GSL-19 TaxID=2812551 RepID=UPI001964EC5A|nr:hypothetical protein [Halobacterium sp. GSL-19]QRY21779.1 hypothetical protein JT689_01570 [Halobacterium sp. GSL-19]